MNGGVKMIYVLMTVYKGIIEDALFYFNEKEALTALKCKSCAA